MLKEECVDCEKIDSCYRGLTVKNPDFADKTVGKLTPGIKDKLLEQ